jgi:hypothetical protein
MYSAELVIVKFLARGGAPHDARTRRRGSMTDVKQRTIDLSAVAGLGSENAPNKAGTPTDSPENLFEETP